MAAGIFNANATDASNSAFASINLAENVMNPSDVNNFVRAWLGAQKRWLLDLGGTVAVGGTATGITITLNESTYTGYGTSANQIPDGAVLMIETTSASSGATTLNINTIGTKKVLRMGGGAISTGDWISGQFLILRYDSSADSASGAWIHVNPTTATQVSFAATQVASSDVNTLDDYEEGTWTPSLKFGGATTGITGTQTGTYIKIGKNVAWWCTIVLTSKGSATGTATVTGLPFTAGSPNFAGSVGYSTISGTATPPTCLVGSGSTTVSLYNAVGTALADTDFTNTTNLIFGGNYVASA